MRRYLCTVFALLLVYVLGAVTGFGFGQTHPTTSPQIHNVAVFPDGTCLWSNRKPVEVKYDDWKEFGACAVWSTEKGVWLRTRWTKHP